MEMENVLSQRRRIMEKGEGEMFSKVCYVVLRGKKNGDGKKIVVEGKCYQRRTYDE